MAYDTKKAPELSVLTGWFDFAKEAARKKHWEFFVIDQFLRGNHNVRGNPDDNTISVSKKTDSISFPINRVFSTFRSVRAFVTRHKPFVQVEVEESTDEAKAYARRSNRVLERDNQLNNFRRINKDWVYYGVKYGVGWRQVGYDPVKKCTQRWTIDPFDLFIGSKTGKMEDAPYVIKTVVRTMQYWKNKYPKSAVVPDNELAADEYKKLAMQINYDSVHNTQQNMDEQTAIGYECWYRVVKRNSNGGFVNKCLFTKEMIVDFEETPFEEYPFIAYESDITPNELYPEGHIKHIISPQRMLNLLNTQMLEYNHIVNRGRYQKEKNAGFRVIYAKEGQIIEHNAGKRVEVLNPPALNPALQWQIQYADTLIEDIGGQHDASQGGVTPGVTAGVAIENLQQGDSNNISDLRDNFEDALSLEAEWILKMYSLFEPDGVVLQEEVGDEKQLFGIVGQQALQKMGKNVPDKYYSEANGSYYDVCAILPDNRVKVSVSSQLGETRQARLDLLMKLAELQIIPGKTVLEYLEFPNTSDLLERIAEEALGQLALDQLKSGTGAPPSGSPPLSDSSVPPQSQPQPQGNGNQELSLIEQLQGLKDHAQSMLHG